MEDPKPLDVLYIVRPGDDNEELRYSLRSLAANLPHSRVFIAGYCPRFVDREAVHYIPVAPPSNRSRFTSSTLNTLAGLEDERMGTHAILMHDDFFVMRPIPAVPILNRGPVSVVQRTSGAAGAYAAGMRVTRAILKSAGFPDPLSYELHVPMIVNAAQMAGLIRRNLEVRALHKRTLYGNLTHMGGRTIPDVKVHGKNDPFDREATFLSTNDGSFKRGAVGAWIRSRFPDPCRYEAPILRPKTEEAEMAHVTYANTVTGRVVTREESLTMNRSRRWKRIEMDKGLEASLELPSSEDAPEVPIPVNEPEAADEAPAPVPTEVPDGRSSREKWAAYAASLGVDVEGLTKAEIRALLDPPKE
jgi:hypothetical protein